MLGFVKSFDVSSSCTRRTECWRHRANSVIIVDTMNCIRRCLRRQGILEWGRVCVILNQNSSVDRLGLNPVGLTKWEKHFFRKIVRPKPDAIFLLREIFGLERCSYEFGCPSKRGTLDNYSKYRDK